MGMVCCSIVPGFILVRSGKVKEEQRCVTKCVYTFYTDKRTHTHKDASQHGEDAQGFTQSKCARERERERERDARSTRERDLKALTFTFTFVPFVGPTLAHKQVNSVCVCVCVCMCVCVCVCVCIVLVITLAFQNWT